MIFIFRQILACLVFVGVAHGVQYPVQTMEASGIERILVRGFKGELSVRASTNDAIRIQAVSSVPVVGADGQETEDLWGFTTFRDGKTLRVEVTSPTYKSDFMDAMGIQKNKIPSFKVSLDIPVVPIEVHWKDGVVSLEGLKASTFVNIDTGSISAKKIEAGLRLRSHRGEVTLSDIKGRVELESYSGKLYGSDIEGKVSANNFSGPIEFQKVKGNVVVENYSGPIVLKNTEGGAQFRTIRGPVKFVAVEGEINGDSREGKVGIRVKGKPKVRIKSDQGDVIVSVPWGKGYWANVGTEKGRMRLPTGLKTEHYGSWKVSQGDVAGSDRGRVFIRTKKGNLSLSRKAL